jgi:glycosyltransferase involved in cell wall biosynthesis
VLVVARFVPENTIVEFFRAVSSFADERDVVIVGSSGYGGELDAMAKRLAEQHRRVRWLGHVADDALLYALWQHAGVYFHGHSVGGTNPALVQAMALGAPILALDTVYNREVLGPEHQHFVPADSGAIAKAVEGLLADPAEQEHLSAQGVARAHTHYTWKAVSASYETVLRRLLQPARRVGRGK